MIGREKSWFELSPFLLIEIFSANNTLFAKTKALFCNIDSLDIFSLSIVDRLIFSDTLRTPPLSNNSFDHNYTYLMLYRSYFLKIVLCLRFWLQSVISARNLNFYCDFCFPVLGVWYWLIFLYLLLVFWTDTLWHPVNWNKLLSYIFSPLLHIWRAAKTK